MAIEKKLILWIQMLKFEIKVLGWVVAFDVSKIIVFATIITQVSLLKKMEKVNRGVNVFIKFNNF